MKFLVINRPTGHDRDTVSGDPAKLREWASTVRGWLAEKRVECCYHMVGGGHAYVFNVDNIDDLQFGVRGNPLFEESHTDVIPVTDAVDFLEHYADHVDAGRIAVTGS